MKQYMNKMNKILSDANAYTTVDKMLRIWKLN